MDNKKYEYEELLKKAAKKITSLNSQIEELHNKKSIAIIGYDCCFPGGANNPELYWELLQQGYDAVREISADRFNVNKYYSEDRNALGKMYTKNAALMDIDIRSFDNTHFEITGEEATSLDPQHRLLLEISWRAMENAGLDIPKLKGSKTGVFLGLSSYEYTHTELAYGDGERITPYTLFGTSFNAAAGRISYFYDFKGPAVTCDTACSSSLVALNTAIDSLRSGQCDLAIVGAANLILCQASFIGLSRLQALAPDGRCKVFDESADGFGRGEGCGVVILKRESDAVKDGNFIEALIKSSVIGQDGKSNGFYAPNGLSEANVMKQAITLSGNTVDDIDYIEAHGTGTVLGDSIEIQAISDVYKNKKERIQVGSVKSNISHLEAAAGMASLIKVLLSIKNRQLPPSIHCKKTNKSINTQKVKVVTEVTEWKKESGKLCAGINCFGISGTLAHVIIEEGDVPVKKNCIHHMPVNILTLSAQSKPSLKRYMADMADCIGSNTLNISDIAYTSNITRSHLPYKFAAVGTNKESVVKAINNALNSDEVFEYNSKKTDTVRKKITFLFTGQGSIYNNIARQMYDYSEEFRQALMVCENAFSEQLDISILKGIYEADESILIRPMYSQPVIFSVEYALCKMWDTLGIVPDLVIGHSIGEIAASCYAGLISFDDAVKLIAYRSKVMDAIEIDGKMVGILSDAETVKNAIAMSGCKNVSIAAVNASNNVTISGQADEVDKVLQVLQKSSRIFINDLGIARPYHSNVMLQYEQRYFNEFPEISFKNPQINIISSITGRLENIKVLGTKEYWTKQLSSKVNFYEAMKEAYNSGSRIFIEIGGNATLCGLAEQCVGTDSTVFVPSLRKGENAYSQFLNSAKILYLNGVKLDWNKLYASYKKEQVVLPNYPFKKKVIWSGMEKQ